MKTVGKRMVNLIERGYRYKMEKEFDLKEKRKLQAQIANLKSQLSKLKSKFKYIIIQLSGEELI